ncbi:MAG: hypothetical protein ABIN97_16080 [Ginsengibacter sp.]
MKQINSKNIFLSLACLGFIIILGAGIYEQINIHSKWITAPPRSLYMFQGSQGIDISVFWKIIHPIVLLFFILALITNWRTTKRKSILIALSGYIVILICTAIYFVPELIKLTAYPYSNTVLPDLQRRASLWSDLNIARAVIIFLLSLNLLLNAVKTENKIS